MGAPGKSALTLTMRRTEKSDRRWLRVVLGLAGAAWKLDRSWRLTMPLWPGHSERQGRCLNHNKTRTEKSDRRGLRGVLGLAGAAWKLGRSLNEAPMADRAALGGVLGLACTKRQMASSSSSGSPAGSAVVGL